MTFLRKYSSAATFAGVPALFCLSGVLALLSAPAAHAGLYVAADRTVAGGNPITSTDFGVYVGRDAANNRFAGVHADLVGAHDSWNLESLSDSVVSVTSGTYIEQLYAQENSTVTVTGGLINNGINVSDRALLTLMGGTSTTQIAVSSAVPTLPGGKRATANVLGGSFNNGAQSSNYGILNISGGSFANAVIGFGNSEITYGGTATTLHMYAYDTTHISVTGGDIGDLRVANAGVVDVYGGRISPNTVYAQSQTAVINFYGNNLQFSNPTAGTFGGSGGFYWDLSGTLRNGDALSTRLFDAGGGVTAPTTIRFNPTAAVPESGTGLLLTCVVLPVAAIASRRRRVMSAETR